MNKRLSGIVYASLAALFYAISIPCSKAMLSSASPTMTAAFLYLGAGLGVFFIWEQVLASVSCTFLIIQMNMKKID